jgi:hypothetical protein
MKKLKSFLRFRTLLRIEKDILAIKEVIKNHKKERIQLNIDDNNLLNPILDNDKKYFNIKYNNLKSELE